MPSVSGASASGPSLPSKLQADHLEFARAIEPWLERLPHGINALQLLTQFGLLVYDQADRLAVIAKGDRPALFTRHVLDSLNPVSLFPTPPQSAIDIGSGAGLPGIPLAIVWPSTRIVLVESREKKAGFLERVVRELGLKNVEVVCSRVEELRATGAGSIDPPAESVFVRALGDLPMILTSIAPHAAPGARWVYFLGARSDAEAIRSSIGAGAVGARVERGAFGGQLLHGTLEANVPRGTFL